MPKPPSWVGAGCGGYYTYHGGIGGEGGRVMGSMGLGFFHDKDGCRAGGGLGEMRPEYPLLGGRFHRFDGT